MKTESKKHVCDELRLIRQELNLSMEKMGKLLGYEGASSYQYYENCELYKRDYFENSFIRRLIEKLVPIGISEERLKALGISEFSHPHENASNALTDAAKVFIRILLEHKLVKPSALIEVFSGQRSEYIRREMMEAQAVMRELIAYVQNLSIQPKQDVLGKVLFEVDASAPAGRKNTHS